MGQAITLEKFKGRTHRILLLQNYIRCLPAACLVRILLRILIVQCHRLIQALEKARGFFTTDNIHDLLPMMRELTEKTDKTIQKLCHLQPCHPRLFSEWIFEDLARIRDLFETETEVLQLTIDPQSKEEMYKAITNPDREVDSKTIRIARAFARSKISSIGRKVRERDFSHATIPSKDLEAEEKELVKEADIFFTETHPE